MFLEITQASSEALKRQNSLLHKLKEREKGRSAQAMDKLVHAEEEKKRKEEEDKKKRQEEDTKKKTEAPVSASDEKKSGGSAV